MRKSNMRILLATAFTIVLLLSGCKKDVPEVTTSEVKNITGISAESGGIIVSDGRSEIISYGVCWSTTENPTTTDGMTADSTATEEFISAISGLLPNTTYYVRAFAVNAIGTGYGDQVSFTTPRSVPVIKTAEVTDILYNSARSGGIMISDGGSPVISYGVCWDTEAVPTVDDQKTSFNVASKSFTSDIRNLTANTRYFVRAYAVNELGISYGDEIGFSTPKRVPLLTSVTVSDVSLNSAAGSFSLISDGGIRVTENGICWSTDPNPEVSDSKSSKAVSKGLYRITGLKPGTTYYIRSYAINSEGIGYGKEITLTTTGKPPVVRNISSSDLTTSGAKVKAEVNAGLLVTETTVEYSTDEKFSQPANSSKKSVSGDTDTAVEIQLSGLKSGTKYFFRVKAVNELGTSVSEASSFVVLMTPTLADFSPITKNYKDSTFVIKPPSSNSPGTFTYTSSNPKVAVIKGNTGIITGSGTCTITANQAPSGFYTAGTISTTFSMNLVDIDGNIYNTIAIGDQDWMKENLKVTRFRNGEPIPNVSNKEHWSTIPEAAYCWVNNDTTNRKGSLGALYNWYAVSDDRRICPTGWHVPTDAEWQIMERHIGMTFVEAEGTTERGEDYGLQLKDSVGWVKKGEGKNTTEFSALPAGLRFGDSGEFYNVGIDACWWTSTEEDASNAWLRNMFANMTSIYRIPDLKSFGFSVRCVRDVRKKPAAPAR